MIILYIILPVTTFAVGFIAGAFAWKLATNQKIEQIKTDAKKSIDDVALDSFEAGYVRAYKDKTAAQAKMLAEKIAQGHISLLV